MAHLQSALRAYALEALRPALVLERMNGFVLEGEQGGMLTLLYAIVDPDGHTVQVASAAHPPPLVLDPGGGSTFVEAPAGNPLGVARYAAYEESTTTLDPWSTVLLYTDGLVEGPELPLGQGLEGLRSSMEGGPREPEALCHAVLDSLDVRAGFRDDLALLALQLTPPGETLALGASGLAVLACLDAACGGAMAAACGGWGGRDLRGAGRLRRGLREYSRARPSRPLRFVVRASRAREGLEVEITVRDTGQWRAPGEDGPRAWARGDAGADGRRGDRALRARHDRQVAASVARRRCDMRDPLAELSFETAGKIVVGRVVGEIESVNAQEMSNALAAQLTS